MFFVFFFKAQLETSDIAEADALVSLMLRRGARNATYAHVLNERRGIHSPLRRFVAADMLEAFNVTLLRKTIFTPEAVAFIDAHEANSAYADYYATSLPWVHFLSNNPSAPYREQDVERLYYIRYSNSVRGHGLFAAEALPTGTVLGQVCGAFVSKYGYFVQHCLPKKYMLPLFCVQYTGIVGEPTPGSLYGVFNFYLARPANAAAKPVDTHVYDRINLDAAAMGNALRFINDEFTLRHNCEFARIIKKCVQRVQCHLRLVVD